MRPKSSWASKPAGQHSGNHGVAGTHFQRSANGVRANGVRVRVNQFFSFFWGPGPPWVPRGSPVGRVPLGSPLGPPWVPRGPGPPWVPLGPGPPWVPHGPMSNTQWPMSNTQWPMSITPWPISNTPWPISNTQWPISISYYI